MKITDKIDALLNEAVIKYSFGNKSVTARQALEIGLNKLLGREENENLF